VFFNLGSAEPRGSAKIVLGSAKYLKKLFIALPLYTGQIFKGKNEQKSLDKVSLG
jgi:hypothetical protein